MVAILLFDSYLDKYNYDEVLGTTENSNTPKYCSGCLC